MTATKTTALEKLMKKSGLAHTRRTLLEADTWADLHSAPLETDEEREMSFNCLDEIARDIGTRTEEVEAYFWPIHMLTYAVTDPIDENYLREKSDRRRAIAVLNALDSQVIGNVIGTKPEYTKQNIYTVLEKIKASGEPWAERRETRSIFMRSLLVGDLKTMKEWL